MDDGDRGGDIELPKFAADPALLVGEGDRGNVGIDITVNGFEYRLSLGPRFIDIHSDTAAQRANSVNRKRIVS